MFQVARRTRKRKTRIKIRETERSDLGGADHVTEIAARNEADLRIGIVNVRGVEAVIENRRKNPQMNKVVEVIVFKLETLVESLRMILMYKL
jgi:hypothetical protein